MTPPDFTRSPYTGWTRAHWLQHADRLLDAVRPFTSASGARIVLPGRASVSGAGSDALEGFARTFLLAAFRIAGARGDGVQELIDRYAAGLAAGADPDHRDAWPRITGDRPSQPMVEAASIALALHETRPWLWDLLDDIPRQHLADWLGGFVGRRTWPNNWMLFQTIVEEFLASIGAPHHETEILRGLDALERWYLGDGWYTDGGGRRIDHYNGWALHFYPLLWTRIAAGGARAELAAAQAATYRDRLRTFLDDYVHLVGADGAPLHQGRSLTYRHAAAAPLWTGALFDCSPLPPGQTRRAASAMLHHFAHHGAPDHRGLLPLGWHGEHLPTVQEYSGPASPYWASKGFLGLLLPPEHPVWQDTELPLPVEQDDQVRAVGPAGWLVQSTTADGIVRLHNHGSDGLDPHRPAIPDPHYARLAYSTASAPTTGPLEPGTMPDNQLTLIAPTGELAGSGPIHPLGASTHGTTGHAGSWYQPHRRDLESLDLPVPGTRVETHALACGPYEVRLHAVTAPRGWQITASGYCLPDGRPGRPSSVGRWTAVRRADGMVSAVTALHGFHGTGLHSWAGSNALGAAPTVPYLIGRHPGGTQVYAACVLLSAEASLTGKRPPVEIYTDEESVEILLPNADLYRWRRLPAPGPDGSLLRLDAVPCTVPDAQTRQDLRAGGRVAEESD